MPVAELTWEEALKQGRRIYDEKVKPELSEADRGSFVEINVATEEWLMDTDEVRLSNRAREKFGSDAKRYLHRVGYRAPHAIGYPLAALAEPI